MKKIYNTPLFVVEQTNDSVILVGSTGPNVKVNPTQSTDKMDAKHSQYTDFEEDWEDEDCDSVL